jgi:hypothetical protein
MMTDQQPQPNPPADADTVPPEVQSDTETANLDIEVGAVDDNPNHEAAKYRIRLREAEAQRDALAAQLDALRRDQIGAIATTMGIKPAALWASGAELNNLLTEGGAIDTTKVREAADAARTELGITKRPPSMAGLSSGTMKPPPPRDAFRDAFVPRRHREPD